MDYCHMICHVLWNFHVISNNFVTVSISQTGVRIHAMTSSVACDVLVTCFNDVILRHLPLYDSSVPALGTWNQSFGFFSRMDFFTKMDFFQNRFSQTWKKFAKMCHRLKSENFKSLPHQDTTSVKKRDISFAQWLDLSETRTELLFWLVEKWVFSHSWYWLINSKGLKIISVCHMSYPSFFILMTS